MLTHLSSHSVFAGDSLELNPLNFRQCAGRAGRRGFDNVGNVLFVGVRLDRIQRLMLSKLPKLVSKLLFDVLFWKLIRCTNAGWDFPLDHDSSLTSQQPHLGFRTGRSSEDECRDHARPSTTVCLDFERFE